MVSVAYPNRRTVLGISSVEMLCESSLWRVVLCQDPEYVDPPTLHPDSTSEPAPSTPSLSTQTSLPVHSSPWQHNTPSGTARNQHDTLHPHAEPAQGSRPLSPGVDIPVGDSVRVEAFLVPSNCQSICLHYSDLLIAGGQVLPLSPTTGHLQGSCSQDPQPGPILLSEDVPIPSLPPALGSSSRVSRRAGPQHWREVSGRERPSLLPTGRPLSNSQLNSYLEQKLLELYKQYLTEGPAGPRPLMASELLESNLEQITLQLSREQNLEASQAKDMLLSCLLRVTSSQQSSQLSTPLLQISNETNCD